MSDLWVVNASPIITLAKAGYLHLLDQLAAILVPEAVVREIDAGPDSDPARRALKEGWGARSAPRELPESVLEWGSAPERAQSLPFASKIAGEPPYSILDDAAARRCARTLSVPILGTLAIVLRAKQAGLISSASQVAVALIQAGLRLDDETLRKALERGAGEPWPPRKG